MENINEIKIKLIQEICSSDNHYLLSTLLKRIENQANIVNEPHPIYQSQQPLSDKEVEEYFKEEEIVFPPEWMEMIERGMDDVKNGRTIDNNEVEKYFEEWLKD